MNVESPDATQDVTTAQATAALDPSEQARLLQALRDEQMPPRIGAFRPISVLGHGGMGTVLLAEQTTPIQRQVAIKLIKPGFDTREIVARFQSERQILARLDHPNIAKVLEAGMSEDGRPYFVMEFVPGEPITRFADAQRLDISARLELFLQVCDAIAHAHTKAILHRDIKATNILAYLPDGKPVAKVIDFGIAKALAGDRSIDLTLQTEVGQMVGTFEYMSPEQARGSADVDTRSDVYALGVLLYELLTGVRPFDRARIAQASYDELRRMIEQDDPPRPSTRLSGLGEEATSIADHRQTRLDRLVRQLRSELEWIPLMAMRKDRQRRYASVQELADDVRAYLAGRPLRAGPESRLYHARKFASRHKVGLIATGLVLISVIGGGTAAAVGFVRATVRNEQRRVMEQFWTIVLDAANPRHNQREVTVRQILDTAAERLDAGELKDQPEVESTFRSVLGRSYLGLGQPKLAETQLRRAWEYERDSQGEGGAAAASALAWLGNAQRASGDVVAARQSLDRALQIYRAKVPADDLRIVDVLNSLAVLEEASGRPQQALAHFEQTLQILQTHPSEKAIGELADVMTNVAATLQRAGDGARAEPLALQALELRRKSFGEESLQVYNSLFNLAYIQEGRSDYPAAEATRRRGMAIVEKLVDEKHQTRALSMYEVGRTLWLRGSSLEEAKQLVEQAKNIYQQIEGCAVDVANCMNLTGCIARDQSDYENAIATFKAEIELRARLQQPEHPSVASALSLLADTLVRAGRPAEAFEPAQRALAIRKRVYPAGHSAIWITTSVLGSAHAGVGEFEKAEPLLLESFGGLEKGSVMGRRATIDAGQRVVQLYQRWNKPEQAAEWTRRLAKIE